MRPEIDMPWESNAIPDWTKAATGATTPSGESAAFRSSCHAWIAIRLVYLADVAHWSQADVELQEMRYRWAWERFVRHGGDMQRLVAVLDEDLGSAAELWNSIDQVELDDAFSTVICEREAFPRTNLASVAMKHFGLHADASVPLEERDRKLQAGDNEKAWRVAPLGACRGCGTPTISQRSYALLRDTLVARPDLFDLSPTYRQSSGKAAPLWSNRVAIAAKGVADHIIPWCDGGRTGPQNLANVCAGCNYSRSSTSLDLIRVAAYR